MVNKILIDTFEATVVVVDFVVVIGVEIVVVVVVIVFVIVSCGHCVSFCFHFFKCSILFFSI